MTEKLSVVIITRNAERELRECLESVTFGDEILVVDSGSTDGTVALAESFGARVLHQPWLGYGPQKQHGATQARHRWILSLDADECVSIELQQSIQSALRQPAHAAYEVCRRNRFMGRWLNHGEGYPDWIVRLFDRTRARWNDNKVHESVVVDGTIGRIKGDLLHQSERGIGDYLEKQNRYTTLQAQLLYDRGKRASAAQIVLSPVFRFVKFYFFRLGFLDGIPGLVHIAIGCFNSFSKYAKLRALEKTGR